MIRWGSTALSVVAGTWAPYQSKTVLSETMLLPDPSDIDAVCTVLQQSGRERYRVKATLMLSMSTYTSLLTDKENATSRTLDDDDTIYAAYYIDTLSAPKIPPYGVITAEIVFVEA